MASSPRSEREEERRHNIRTLVIASVASATAAAVTSQLWIAGTWIAAAITPVLVALVSELLNRPAERIARARTSERPALPEDPAEPPVRIYRAGSPPQRSSRRKLAIRTVLAIGGLAFVIAAVTLTTAELIAGGSIGQGDRRTTLGGGNTKQRSDPADERRDETTEQQPAETETTTTPTETETTPTETETAPAPAQETAPAPPAETAPAP